MIDPTIEIAPIPTKTTTTKVMNIFIGSLEAAAIRYIPAHNPAHKSPDPKNTSPHLTACVPLTNMVLSPENTSARKVPPIIGSNGQYALAIMLCSPITIIPNPAQAWLTIHQNGISTSSNAFQLIETYNA